MPDPSSSTSEGVPPESDTTVIDPVVAQRHAQVLPELFARIRSSSQFEPGTLVVWKPGLRNRLLPHYGQPAVVIERLDTPLFDPSSNAATPYFREPLDLVIGIIDPDGDFVAYHVDSRRFQVRS